MPDEISLIPLSENLLHQVVDIHYRAFSGYMNTKLGRNYLIDFFSWFMHHKDGVSIVAVENGQRAQGYVIGAPIGYSGAISRDLFWRVTKSIVQRPWLLMDWKIQNALIERVKIVLGSFHTQRQYADLPPPTMSLVGIAVNTQSRHQGIGKRLMQAFEKESINSQMKSMRLSVYPENKTACQLYETCGWQPFAASLQSPQIIFYGKVLDRCAGS